MGGDKASVVAIDSNRFGSFVKNMNLQADPPKIARIAQPERTNPPDRSGIFGWVCLGIGSIFMEERKTRRAGHPTRRKTRVEHRQILAIHSKRQPGFVRQDVDEDDSGCTRTERSEDLDRQGPLPR